MPDGVTQFEKNPDKNVAHEIDVTTDAAAQRAIVPPGKSIYAPQIPIIWTSRFIIIFAVTLVVGLSLGSVLTQGWANGYYRKELILLGYSFLNLASLTMVAIVARSTWARLGAIFGSIWAIFLLFNGVISLYGFNRDPVLAAHVNAATTSALLGCYVCLSVEHTPFQRWDSWFFRLAPIVGVIALTIAFFLLPAEARSSSRLENTFAAVALYLCVATWWARPSCWQTHPGPTFIFGLAPLIQLLLPEPNGPQGQNHFFFSQMILLCVLLATMRILQYHLRSAAMNTTKR